MIKIRASLKMQKIIKQRTTFSDRQLCFYENFWFFSQNNHFLGISPILGDSCHAFCPVQVFDCGRNAWRKSPKKWRNAKKMAILTKESKKFHKSKVDSLQKLSTRACLFNDLLQFRGCPFKKGEILEKLIVGFLKFFSFPFSMTF